MNLTEQKERIKELIGFKYKNNSHDILSEENIKKSLITEQKVSLVGLADEAKEKDSEIVQSTPGYKETIDWWSRGGPTKGKARQDKSVSVNSLQYWNGDLSAKMTNPKSTGPTNRISKLTNEKNVNKIIKNIQSIASAYTKKYPNGKRAPEVLDYKVATIVDAATQIQNALNELSKNGNYIGAELENGGKYNVYGDAGKGDKPTRLNILPFVTNDDKYVGKILFNDIKFFNHWYKQLSNVGDIIEIINNRAYWGKGEGKSFTVISDKDKIGLLQGFSERANKSEKRSISNALVLKIGPKGATWEKATDEIVYKTAQISQTGYPKDGVETQFFAPDSSDIPPAMISGFNNWLNEKLNIVKQENGKIRQIGITLIASTNAVPSTRFKGTGGNGNEALVKARVAAMRKTVEDAVNAAGIDPSLVVFYTHNAEGKSTLVPNNPKCGEWGEAEQNKYKDAAYRKANPTIKADYEKKYASCRFASFGLNLLYDTPEDKDEITEYTKVGNWKESISWYSGDGGGRIPRGKLPRTPKYKGNTYDCPTWGKGKKSWIQTPMGLM